MTNTNVVSIKKSILLQDGQEVKCTIFDITSNMPNVAITESLFNDNELDIDQDTIASFVEDGYSSGEFEYVFYDENDDSIQYSARFFWELVD